MLASMSEQIVWAAVTIIVAWGTPLLVSKPLEKWFEWQRRRANSYSRATQAVYLRATLKSPNDWQGGRGDWLAETVAEFNLYGSNEMNDKLREAIAAGKVRTSDAAVAEAEERANEFLELARKEVHGIFGAKYLP